MTIRTFEQQDRIIIEVSNPTTDIKKAINAGFNVDTIKFLAAQQNTEIQDANEIAAIIDNNTTVTNEMAGNNVAQNDVSQENIIKKVTAENTVNEVANTMSQNSRSIVETPIEQEPIEQETSEQTVEQSTSETPNESNIIRTIFSSNKETSFNILATSIENINAGTGDVFDVKCAIAARKVILGQVSDDIVKDLINAGDGKVLAAWNNGLNNIVYKFYNSIYNQYVQPQVVPEGFEPVSQTEIPFAAPEPINSDWQ